MHDRVHRIPMPLRPLRRVYDKLDECPFGVLFRVPDLRWPPKRSHVTTLYEFEARAHDAPLYVVRYTGCVEYLNGDVMSVSVQNPPETKEGAVRT